MDIKAALNKIAVAPGFDRRGNARRHDDDHEGEATPSQIGAFLMGLRVKGETVGEIAAAVSILREKMVAVEAPEDAIDIVGTGGDGAETLNISTATAIVVCRRRHPRRQARQQRAVVQLRARRRAARPWRQDRPHARANQRPASARPASASCSRRPIIRRLKHVGSTRIEMGTRTMFNLLGPQVEPRRRPPLHAGRLFQAMGRAGRRRPPRQPRHRRLGRPRRRRPRRNLDHRPDLRRLDQGRHPHEL